MLYTQYIEQNKLAVHCKIYVVANGFTHRALKYSAMINIQRIKYNDIAACKGNIPSRSN